MRRRVTASGGQWSQKRTALFLIGIAGYLWCIDGFLNAYRSTLLGVWAVQVLVLMLVIPIALMAGRPVELAALKRVPIAAAKRLNVLPLQELPGRLSATRPSPGSWGTLSLARRWCRCSALCCSSADAPICGVRVPGSPRCWAWLWSVWAA